MPPRTLYVPAHWRSDPRASDLPPAHKPLPPAAEYKSDAYYGGKYDEKKQDLSGMGLDGFPVLQKKDKNPYGNIGAAALGGYEDKKDRKVSARFLASK